MSKITFRKKFNSLLLWSTVLTGAVVFTGFVGSIMAMEAVGHDEPGLAQGASFANNPDFLALPEAQKRVFRWSLERGPLSRELARKVGDMTTGRSKTNAEKESLISSWLREERDLARYMNGIAQSAKYLALPEQDRTDLIEGFRSVAGGLSNLSPYTASEKTPREKIDVIEEWLNSRVEMQRDQQKIAQLLNSMENNALYAWMTATDRAEFNREMTSPTGAFSTSYTENKDPRVRLAKIRAWLSDRQAVHEGNQKIAQLLNAVENNALYAWMTATDRAEFDREMTSPTGAFSTSYTENKDPRVRLAKIKAWLSDRQADRVAEKEMVQFLEHVRGHPSYLSLKESDWEEFTGQMSGMGSLSATMNENRRAAVRLGKIKAWLSDRQADRLAEQEMVQFLEHVRGHPSYLSLKESDWEEFTGQMSGMGSLSATMNENRRAAVRLGKIKAWLSDRQADRLAEQKTVQF